MLRKLFVFVVNCFVTALSVNMTELMDDRKTSSNIF